MCAEIVHGVRIRVEMTFLVDEQRLEEIAKEIRIAIEEERYSWEDDIHCVDVTTRARSLLAGHSKKTGPRAIST